MVAESGDSGQSVAVVLDPRPLPKADLPKDFDQLLAGGREFPCSAVSVRRPRSFGAIAGCRLTVSEKVVALRFLGRTYAFVTPGQGTVELGRSRLLGVRVRLVSELVDATLTPNDEDAVTEGLTNGGWLAVP
jgi:hypothetical protein